MRTLLLGLALVVGLDPFTGPRTGSIAQAAPVTGETYEFTVYLGDEHIGSQRFLVSTDGEQTRVRVEARFEVTFLFFTAYTYRHSNVEIWEGPCLRSIDAITDDNGDSFFVRGAYEDGRLRLRTHAGRFSLEGCVRTFAYWDLDRIQGSRLLNSQTGEHQSVDVRLVGEETITVRGVPTRTEHHEIMSDTFTIDLWYTLEGAWVALRSTTESGDPLRYQLQ